MGKKYGPEIIAEMLDVYELPRGVEIRKDGERLLIASSTASPATI
ncbi:MAG: hypothetical protein ACREKH_20045 [Candidatus Rokuibacteriota bacterium]